MSTKLNSELEERVKMNLTTLSDYLTSEESKGKVLFDEVMEDRKKRIASGGGARVLAEKRRLDAQEEFVSEGVALKPKLEMRSKLFLALEKLRQDALQVDLTDPNCDIDAEDRESKREKAMQNRVALMDRSIRSMYASALGEGAVHLLSGRGRLRSRVPYTAHGPRSTAGD